MSSPSENQLESDWPKQRSARGRSSPKEKPQGILRLDINSANPRRSSMGIRSPSFQLESPSPQPSIDHLSVTFAPEERSMCSDNSVKVNFFAPDSSEAKMGTSHLPAPDLEGSEDEDYSASVNAVMMRRASTRKSRRRSSKRRASSPFSPDLDSLCSVNRRRSSVFTTSSGETVITVDDTTGSEEMYELLKLHKEVLSTVRTQPWPMRRKLRLVQTAQAYVKQHEGALQQRLAASRNTRDVVKRFRLLANKKWQYIRREIANASKYLTPWELRIKQIESHFGSVVASYFTFLRWLFWVNLVISGTLIAFVAVPELLTADWKNSGERKVMLPEEQRVATNLVTLWNFGGVLKYSPLFYGYYSNKNGTGGYRLPLAYFVAGLLVYVYSFIATLRKMAKNSRMSKLSEKEDECVFTWKLFTGWDFMIGNAETAQNRVSSLVLGFKEALLEEAEKKREDRNWKVIASRVFVNLMVLVLLGMSAYAVIFVVQRSTEEGANNGWWRQNEITLVLSLISTIFPTFFELLGFLEYYHPRKQLRLQLARIMALNLLNLYSLIFALFGKIEDMQDELQKLKLNATHDDSLEPYSVLNPPLPTSGLPLKTFLTSTTSNNLSFVTPHCYNIIINCTEWAINITQTLTTIFLTTLVTHSTINSTDFTKNNFSFFENTTTISENLNDTFISDYYNLTTDFPTLNASDFEPYNYTSSFLENFKNFSIRLPIEPKFLENDTYDEFYDYDYEEFINELINNISVNENNNSANTLKKLSMLANDSIFSLNNTTSTESSLFEFVNHSITSNYGDATDTVSEQCYITKCEELTDENLEHEELTTVSSADDLKKNLSFLKPRKKQLPRNLERSDIKLRKKLRDLCWETMFGQELVKLTIMDLMLTVLSTLIMDFFRALFVRYMNNCWCWDLEKKFPQYGDFKIAENILHLVNNQGMVWMGMFFSPGLALINLIKLVIMMYLRSWTVLTCNVPHEIVFRASRSNNFYFALLLTMLFLCVLPVGYAMVWVKPSWHCGPFSGYDTISQMLTKTLHDIVPHRLHRVLDYIASPGIVIPLLVLLVLIIYYLTSLSSALREANNDLKIQLRRERTEERRKMFQIADKRYKTGSASLDNAPLGKWKRLLASMPKAQEQENKQLSSNDAEGLANAEKKAENKKREIMARIIKNAFGVQSVQSEEDGTDNEFHESILEDNKDEKQQSKKSLEQVHGKKIFTKQNENSKKSNKARQNSDASIWSENIPVITISKTESAECIIENKANQTPVVNENTEATNDSIVPVKTTDDNTDNRVQHKSLFNFIKMQKTVTKVKQGNGESSIKSVSLVISEDKIKGNVNNVTAENANEEVKDNKNGSPEQTIKEYIDDDDDNKDNKE